MCCAVQPPRSRSNDALRPRPQPSRGCPSQLGPASPRWAGETPSCRTSTTQHSHACCARWAGLSLPCRSPALLACAAHCSLAHVHRPVPPNAPAVWSDAAYHRASLSTNVQSTLLCKAACSTACRWPAPRPQTTMRILAYNTCTRLLGPTNFSKPWNTEICAGGACSDGVMPGWVPA